MLDPVTKLSPVQTGHHYGVDQFSFNHKRVGLDVLAGSGHSNHIERKLSLVEESIVFFRKND